MCKNNLKSVQTNFLRDWDKIKFSTIFTEQNLNTHGLGFGEHHHLETLSWRGHVQIQTEAADQN